MTLLSGNTDWRPRKKLLALFVLLSGIPLIALGWLGWRVLEQDRALEVQRLRDRLENGASLVTQELERELAAWETAAQHAADGRSPEPACPGDAPHSLRGMPSSNSTASRLPYQPQVRSSEIITPQTFADAEALEFQRDDLPNAAAAYRRAADYGSSHDSRGRFDAARACAAQTAPPS